MPSTQPASARPQHLPFEGIGSTFILSALGVLGLPFVLRGLGVPTDQWAGVVFALGLAVLGGAGAIWVVLDGGPGPWLGLAALGLGAGVALTAGYPLVRGLLPATPAASRKLHQGQQLELANLKAGGDFDLVLHAEIADEAGSSVHARYRLSLTSGGRDQTLAGRFDSSQARTRVGRRSVKVTRAPREWERHQIRLASGRAVVRLDRADSQLGREVEVQLYRRPVSWPFLVTAGALTLLAGFVGAHLERRRWRHLVGSLATATIGSAVGCHWTWPRDALNPLLVAALVALAGAWLLAQILAGAAALAKRGRTPS